MIHESFYWKEELYKSFRIISNARISEIMNEKAFVRTEKALMFGAYIIRKLDEAQKIPPDFMEKIETLEFLNRKNSNIDYLNCGNIEKHYETKNFIKVKKDWMFIVNQLIHSFSFFYSFDENKKLNGFLINSDKTKKVALYFLPIELVFKIFLTISEGSVVLTNSSKDLKKDINGKLSYDGEMKLISAIYDYPENIDIDKIIKKCMLGKTYTRKK